MQAPVQIFKAAAGSLLAALALMLVLSPAVVAAPAPNASTTLSFSANPATLSGNSNPDVTITTTTTATVSAAIISQGKVTIQYATSAGVPVPAGTAGAIWNDLNPPGQSPDGSGTTTLAVDLDALGATPGMSIGFRAHYVTGGGATKADTHFSPAVDLGIASSDACAPGEVGKVIVGATEANGVGVVAPGASGPWTFKISVKNCTTSYLAGVKVQGGSNGWAPVPKTCLADGVTAGGSEWCIHPSTGTYGVRANNKNQVITWTPDIAADATETILVKVNGTVPLSTPDGQIRFLSGPWSAVYDTDGTGPLPSEKSDYSGRVSLCVDATAAIGDGDSLCGE